MKFLRARYAKTPGSTPNANKGSRIRNLNVREAHAMMVATLRWRDEFNVTAAVQEDFPPEVFAQLGHVYGHDKGGRPVMSILFPFLIKPRNDS
jgi:hypothetical protein